MLKMKFFIPSRPTVLEELQIDPAGMLRTLAEEEHLCNSLEELQGSASEVLEIQMTIVGAYGVKKVWEKRKLPKEITG